MADKKKEDHAQEMIRFYEKLRAARNILGEAKEIARKCEEKYKVGVIEHILDRIHAIF
jgi:hypothetical protein